MNCLCSKDVGSFSVECYYFLPPSDCRARLPALGRIKMLILFLASSVTLITMQTFLTAYMNLT